ncbi:hypothetical protein [Echinimonas agarilytica]|uniref:Right handed beta helix domain-containing protein n=1 Tax=Echinimonas agarilytica TaxID=1215918 RepID=A0AA41WCB1_9GAMM|nr:hypothetical protein [Echinimonas agarilytica]MCM2681501.1 hypothetical protein [Echinimonas agarilytica]
MLSKKILIGYLIACSVIVHAAIGIWAYKSTSTVLDTGVPLSILAEQKLRHMEKSSTVVEQALKPALKALANTRLDQTIPLTPRTNIMPVQSKAMNTAGACFVDSGKKLLETLEKKPHCKNTIVLPGTYTLKKRVIKVAGSHRIIQAGGDAVIRLLSEEGIYISSPHINFSGFRIEGVCKSDYCDHIFHVVGKAKHTVLHNNVLVNANAAIKVNGLGKQYPDQGIISENIIFNTTVRRSKRSVTPIDIVAANEWDISNNTIFDFHKVGSNGTSYGLFVKGGGQGSNISGNLVVCDAKNKSKGVQIGLSIGGGGTGKEYRRQGSRGYEYKDTVMNHNLVLNCTTDVGIYINKGQDITLANNIVLSSSGIDVRYAVSSALFRNNIITGRILSRDGGHFDASANLIRKLSTVTAKDYSFEAIESASQLDFSTSNEGKHSANAQTIEFSKALPNFCGKLELSTDYLGLSDQGFCSERLSRVFEHDANSDFTDS